jgi:SAM-dependent methyltransferase
MAASAPAAMNGTIASTARRHPGATTWRTVTNSAAPAKATIVAVATAGQLIHPRNSPVTAAHFTLELARRNAAAAGVDNVEFVHGYLEDIPLPDASVDVVISNCVVNLTADKSWVLAEAARVLRPAGRFAVSDVLADEHMDEATRADVAARTGCIAGALTRAHFSALLEAAGMVDVEITETHRVHPHASAALIRARKPSISPETQRS